jgi:hypothetical protein
LSIGAPSVVASFHRIDRTPKRSPGYGVWLSSAMAGRLRFLFIRMSRIRAAGAHSWDLDSRRLGKLRFAVERRRMDVAVF